ncbi:MAG TPA: methyltransferase [Chitinophagaceae bacterium]|jgi:precorrin-6B methylase 2|nr:methyltransferase [Chitinophagaceae bacterium]
MQANQPSPEKIMQIGLGFWPSKTLLAAVNLGLFTHLAASGKSSGSQIKKQFSFQCTDRHVYDFLDTLTSFGFLQREGLLETALYSNAAETDLFLDKKKPAYIGGILEMANNRLYPFWGDLEAGLATGHAQNEAKHDSDNLFDTLYASPERLKEFVHAMSGIQMGNFMLFAQQFDFSNYKTLTDAGGAGAMLSCMVAKHQPHMQCTSFDLAAVNAVAQENIGRFELAERVKTFDGDFFQSPLPAADIVVMGNILHDWDEEKKLALMKKAWEALPEGGAFVAIENVIDDDRRKNAFGLMMSLNMLIETGVGFDYTFNDFTGWARQAGFIETRLMPLTGPSSAAIAVK